MSNPEVEVIGLLPAQLQQMTTYSAGTTTSARQVEAAQAFIRHLAAPEAMRIYKTKGLAL
jgi:molybdate transport system substrate-binding protein